MRLRALDGGHLGDVWQRGAGGIAWVASERQLRSVIGSGIEPKGPIWMGCRRNRKGISSHGGIALNMVLYYSIQRS